MRTKSSQKVVAVIQARMSSSRLPGKVLLGLPFGSKTTVLGQVLHRVRASKLVDEVVVATTDGREDLPVVRAAQNVGATVFRGDRDNVLSRYYGAAVKSEADIVVRITSDCPCIDPRIVDKVIDTHLSGSDDYTSNTLVRSYPRGMDTEAFSFGALERSFKEASLPYEKEHVTPYIYTHKSKFRVTQVESPSSMFFPSWRLTLDTKEDYAFLCSVYDELYCRNLDFSLQDIVSLIKKKPWLLYVNEKIEQKKIRYSLATEMTLAKRLLSAHGLSRAAARLDPKVEK